MRHGDSNGYNNSLSELGVSQVNALRKIIVAYLRDIYGHDAGTLRFSFSSYKRMIESSTLLSKNDYGEDYWDMGDMVVTELFLANRCDIGESRITQIVQMVLSRIEHWGASIAIIVAHGDMPAVFAETVRRMAKGHREFDPLPDTEEARGYIISVETGEVLKLSPEGITSLFSKPKLTMVVGPDDSLEDIEWCDDEASYDPDTPRKDIVWWDDYEEALAIWEASRRYQRRRT